MINSLHICNYYNPVMLAITSLSKIRSPKYLRFSL